MSETKQQQDQYKNLGNVVAEGESARGGYNAYNTGTKGTLRSGVKDLSRMTINQILAASELGGNDPNRIFAAGKYQIIPNTMKAAMAAIPLTGNELFTPATQEKIFLQYLVGSRRKPIANYIRKGQGTVIDAVHSSAMEWASIEVPAGRSMSKGRVSDGTKSYYESKNNHAKRGSGAKMKTALEQVRATFLNPGDNPQPVQLPVDEQDKKKETVEEQKPEAKPEAKPETKIDEQSRDVRAGHIINGSVGRRGQNEPQDVGAVQGALKAKGVSPGPLDKKFGPLTLRGIKKFQRGFMKYPDGLVEVGKKTEQHLRDGSTTVDKTQDKTPKVDRETETQPTKVEAQTTSPIDNAQLNDLMAKQRLSSEEIGRARKLIAQEPKASQPDLYRQLQTKVMYANQRDNTSTSGGQRIGDVMCNLTSLAMCLQYLGVANPHPEMQFEDALEKVRRDKRLPARTEAAGWGGVADALGVKHKSLGGGTKSRTWWTNTVGPVLASGSSVMCSISGHIVRVQAVTDQGLVVDDPYGLRKLKAGGEKQWTNVQNNNAKNPNAGEDNVWTWDTVEPHVFRWVESFSR